jgi:hypothetical protein
MQEQKLTVLGCLMLARKCFTQSTEYRPLTSFGSNQLIQYSLKFILIRGMILADYSVILVLIKVAYYREIELKIF